MEDNLEQMMTDLEGSTNTERSMSAPETTETASEQTTAPQNTTPQESFFEFESGGKQVKVPQNDPRVKQWLQMGYSAPTRFGQLNQEVEKYKTQIKDYEGKFKSYEPFQQIDEWAKQNPDKWQQIETLYREQLSGSPQAQQTQLPPEVIQKLDEHGKILNDWKQEKEIQRADRADQGYNQEMESIRKQYPNLDFYTPDETENSLEAKILDHALAKQIPSFTAAFRDYFHDNLIKMAEEKGRESSGKTLAKTKSLGLQGKSPAPTRQNQMPSNLRKLNYDQILQEAMRIEGIAD